MIFIGLMLIPVVVLIIFQLNKFNIKRTLIMLLNACLIALSILYVLLSLMLKSEPFNFQVQSPGDYIINSAVIFIFSPFLWIVLFYYCNHFFKNIRVRKNAKLKSDKGYIYYRDDLDKISPSIIMYVSKMSIETKTIISATILKLKLMGYIKESNNTLYVTEKETDDLPESDILVLSSLSNGVFHEREYKKLVKNEALDSNYIKSNKHGKFIKIIKMLIIIISPIIFTGISDKLDNYVFDNYRFYEKDNGIDYLKLTNRKQAEKLYYSGDIDINDYYYTTIEIDGEEEISYNYAYIRADRLKYPIVMFSCFLNILVPISILLCILLYFASAFKLTEQIIYFNKEYYRTVEGNKLLNKAYALKNYLKDYSIMKYRSEDELILWEYYMVYAVVLDVNTKIKNEIVEKHLQYISLY